MISPNIGADLAQPVAEFYADAELSILRRIAAMLADGIDADDWEVLQLARLQQVRGEILALLQRINPQAAEVLRQQIELGYDAGQASALADVGRHVPHAQAQTAERVQAVIALARDTGSAMQSAQGGILRFVDDVYRRTVADAAARVVVGNITRAEAVTDVLTRLTSEGLRGVETKRGTMDLETYASMAVRTATARSAVAGHEGAMSAMGLDLVVIHPGPRACKICDRWARMILARRGATGTLTVASLTSGQPVQVEVGATLAAARAGGWGHPNCRCNLAAYLPGVTRADEIQRPAWDEDAYVAQQQQRAVERSIRNAKRAQATALTPQAQAEARDRIKGAQATMRGLLAEHPYLKRQSAREQLGSQLGTSPQRPLVRGAGPA